MAAKAFVDTNNYIYALTQSQQASSDFPFKSTPSLIQLREPQ
jgi:hypothetical protein